MRYLSILLLPFIISCGDVGETYSVGEYEIAQTGLTTGSTTTYPSFRTKVIDGYVSGANVYIDFNLNLQQDEGEPSAEEVNNAYVFTNADFSAINNYTEACALNRPRIAEVPVGAYDSDRGYVSEAYIMYYFPAFYVADGEANITPFTTLFLSILNEVMTGQTISVADSCNTTTTTLSNSIKAEVEGLLYNLEQQFNIPRDEFYEDYIASGNATQQEIGERIVDFLSLFYSISEIVESETGVFTSAIVNPQLLQTILSNTSFTTMDFSIVNRGLATVVNDDFNFRKLIRFNNLTVNHSGKIIVNEEELPITYNNLVASSDLHITEQYESTTVVTGKHTTLGTDRGTDFIRFSNNSNDCFNQILGPVVSKHCGSSTKYLTELRLPNNPYDFKPDITALTVSLNIYELQNIDTDLVAIPIGMDNHSYLIGYLYSGDFLVFEKVSNNILWHYRYGTGVETCENIDMTTNTILNTWTGIDGFNQCDQEM